MTPYKQLQKMLETAGISCHPRKYFDCGAERRAISVNMALNHQIKDARIDFRFSCRGQLEDIIVWTHVRNQAKKEEG